MILIFMVQPQASSLTYQISRKVPHKRESGSIALSVMGKPIPVAKHTETSGIMEYGLLTLRFGIDPGAILRVPGIGESNNTINERNR